MWELEFPCQDKLDRKDGIDSPVRIDTEIVTSLWVIPTRVVHGHTREFEPIPRAPIGESTTKYQAFQELPIEADIRLPA